MNKEVYESLIMELVIFENEDVISTSDPDIDGDNGKWT